MIEVSEMDEIEVGEQCFERATGYPVQIEAIAGSTINVSSFDPAGTGKRLTRDVQRDEIETHAERNDRLEAEHAERHQQPKKPSKPLYPA